MTAVVAVGALIVFISAVVIGAAVLIVAITAVVAAVGALIVSFTAVVAVLIVPITVVFVALLVSSFCY